MEALSYSGRDCRLKVVWIAYCLQWLSFSLFMMLVRPFLVVLIMLLSGYYIDAFSSEEVHLREAYPSVADDLVGLVHDSLNRGDQKV